MGDQKDGESGVRRNRFFVGMMKGRLVLSCMNAILRESLVSRSHKNQDRKRTRRRVDKNNRPSSLHGELR